MNIILSALLFASAIYIGFFSEPKCNHKSEFTGGMWVTRDAKGQVLSGSPYVPVFYDDLNDLQIKGIVTYGYEWKIKENK